MRDKPLIAAPRKLDRPLVLSHSRGLQSKGFSSQILESSSVRIHKKSDSSAKVDRHADKSARDDRKTSNAQNPPTPSKRKDFEARIGALQGERGDKPRWLSHKRAEAIHDSSPKANARKENK